MMCRGAYSVAMQELIMMTMSCVGSVAMSTWLFIVDVKQDNLYVMRVMIRR